MKIHSTAITHSVWEAAGEGLYLPIGEKILAEYLSNQCDGIFPNKQSWRSFVRGNFLGTGASKDYFQPIKESTIKKWCIPEQDYISQFVAQIGLEEYVSVPVSDLELTYDYEALYWSDSDKRDGLYPDIIEIYVTANFKGQ